ncbi:hypothetical protein DAPPUDRAFT_239027 [Daphnia pulex]|uniref:Uncharacterized protein n=1 Tax=Daphnia pulex TaxID=6669 RepID=E9G854_DAPPU|nr:hypothetical protein DAPPUDRAFT_239027 [Daphnia pulex]|eukprot:EFX83916.1 hypothetical protein DAPPUDRAFT_239027 [Daphnia pulex]
MSSWFTHVGVFTRIAFCCYFAWWIQLFSWDVALVDAWPYFRGIKWVNNQLESILPPTHILDLPATTAPPRTNCESPRDFVNVCQQHLQYREEQNGLSSVERTITKGQ